MCTGADGLSAQAADAAALERELAWLGELLQARICLHFGQPCAVQRLEQIAAPALDADPSAYARLVHEAGLGWDERLVLALALAPHLRPQALDLLLVRNANLERGHSEFGGWRGRTHGGFLPSGETAAFLLAGEDLARRRALLALFDSGHAFSRLGLLRLDGDAGGEPSLAAPLQATPEALARVGFGTPGSAAPDPGFPAQRVDTALGWDDLVLDEAALAEVQALAGWCRHGRSLLDGWGLARFVKPGYRSLFFGPPGTGKTLTATLIGRSVGAEVYRIDLSMLVSKYIGETEKNLARVFDRAQHRRWILFFDEADALFGKRTATSSAHDRYANQEVAYLLQRIEDYPGVVILATNLRANLDEAFARRFQSQVHFAMPDGEQRLRLWQGMASATGRLDRGVDLAALAEAHELSGGAIANVLRAAALAALLDGRAAMTQADLRAAVARELRKEGRTL